MLREALFTAAVNSIMKCLGTSHMARLALISSVRSYQKAITIKSEIKSLVGRSLKKSLPLPGRFILCSLASDNCSALYSLDCFVLLPLLWINIDLISLWV